MGPMGPTLENFLNCIRAPLHCALHVDLLFARDQEVIVQFSLQDWLREDICKAVLESLNSLELRFGYNESESTYVHNIRMGYNESSSIPLHCILSGSITIHRSFDSGGLKAHCKILECIDQMIRPFRALGFSTKLNLGGAASYFLADFVAQLGQLPPFTHLELAQYTETTGSGYNIIYEALRGADPHLSFSFSAIRDLVFRDTTPENIKRLIGAALGDHSTSDSLAFATRKKTLDKVEIHIEQRHFEEAEILVKELRDDRRIGEVSLYVTL
ncbi:hypothetical protein FRB90_007490 [Tulasnella sp. 427]|nr:hypothetical protein FRB90_007490 [Tulasnella sp. 427]